MTASPSTLCLSIPKHLPSPYSHNPSHEHLAVNFNRLAWCPAVFKIRTHASRKIKTPLIASCWFLHLKGLSGGIAVAPILGLATCHFLLQSLASWCTASPMGVAHKTVLLRVTFQTRSKRPQHDQGKEQQIKMKDPMSPKKWMKNKRKRNFAK